MYFLYNWFTKGYNTKVPLTWEQAWNTIPNFEQHVLVDVTYNPLFVDVLGSSEPWLVDQSCNDWYFMISASGLLFNLITDYSFFNMDFSVGSTFKTSFDINLICILTGFDIVTKYRSLQNYVFIQQSIINLADSYWIKHVLYPTLLQSQIYLLTNTIYSAPYILLYKNFILALLYSCVYNILMYTWYYSNWGFYFIFYDLVEQLTIIDQARLTFYIYWIIRGILSPPILFLWCLLIFNIFHYYYNQIFYLFLSFFHWCYEVIWVEGLEYWLEYINLRLWSRLERSYYSTCKLNHLYSWNYNTWIRRRRNGVAFYFFFIFPKIVFLDIWKKFKNKKLVIAFEWYSKIYMQQQDISAMRLNIMFSAFIGRFLFIFFYTVILFFIRVACGILLRYAGALRFLHFYLYGIFLGISWVWWNVNLQNCYKPFISLVKIENLLATYFLQDVTFRFVSWYSSIFCGKEITYYDAKTYKKNPFGHSQWFKNILNRLKPSYIFSSMQFVNYKITSVLTLLGLLINILIIRPIFIILDFIKKNITISWKLQYFIIRIKLKIINILINCEIRKIFIIFKIAIIFLIFYILNIFIIFFLMYLIIQLISYFIIQKGYLSAKPICFRLLDYIILCIGGVIYYIYLCFKSILYYILYIFLFLIVRPKFWILIIILIFFNLGHINLMCNFLTEYGLYVPLEGIDVCLVWIIQFLNKWNYFFTDQTQELASSRMINAYIVLKSLGIAYIHKYPLTIFWLTNPTIPFYSFSFISYYADYLHSHGFVYAKFFWDDFYIEPPYIYDEFFCLLEEYCKSFFAFYISIYCVDSYALFMQSPYFWWYLQLRTLSIWWWVIIIPKILHFIICFNWCYLMPDITNFVTVKLYFGYIYPKWLVISTSQLTHILILYTGFNLVGIKYIIIKMIDIINIMILILDLCFYLMIEWMTVTFFIIYNYPYAGLFAIWKLFLLNLISLFICDIHYLFYFNNSEYHMSEIFLSDVAYDHIKHKLFLFYNTFVKTYFDLFSARSRVNYYLLYKKFHSINPHAVVLATPWSTLYEETESYYSEIMFDAELYISYIFDVGAFSYRDWKDYKELILSNLFNIVTFYDWHLRKIYYCVFVFFITWLQLLCIVWIFYSLVVRDVHCSPEYYWFKFREQKSSSEFWMDSPRSHEVFDNYTHKATEVSEAFSVRIDQGDEYLDDELGFNKDDIKNLWRFQKDRFETILLIEDISELQQWVRRFKQYYLADLYGDIRFTSEEIRLQRLRFKVRVRGLVMKKQQLLFSLVKNNAAIDIGRQAINTVENAFSFKFKDFFLKAATEDLYANLTNLPEKFWLIIARGYRRDSNLRQLTDTLNECFHFLVDPILYESAAAAVNFRLKLLKTFRRFAASYPFYFPTWALNKDPACVTFYENRKALYGSKISTAQAAFWLYDEAFLLLFVGPVLFIAILFCSNYGLEAFVEGNIAPLPFMQLLKLYGLNNTYYLSYIHDTPIATFPGLAPSTAGSIGAPEWDLRYSVMLKWHEFDPLYNFTLAHAKTCEQIVPNMYAIPWNCSLQIEGHRWLAIDPYIQIIKRPFWFIGWWIKIKLVLILDFLFSYTPGSYCSINFWYYKCLRIAFFIIFIFIAYIKLRISVIEVESITINLNKDMLIFIKKYLSFSPKRWANYFYGINS